MEYMKEALSLLGAEPFSKVLTTVIIIFSLWLLNVVVTNVIEKRVSELKSRYTWRKTVSYVIVFGGIFIVSRVWLEGIQSLATFLSLLSAGFAIALKDLVANLAGRILLVWRRPFDIGNRIQVGEISGDVIDLRPFQFTLLEIGNWVKADQSTGRTVHVPNNKVFYGANR